MHYDDERDTENTMTECTDTADETDEQNVEVTEVFSDELVQYVEETIPESVEGDVGEGEQGEAAAVLGDELLRHLKEQADDGPYTYRREVDADV